VKKLLTMMDALLRDRESLYTQAAEGENLGRLCGRLLLIFAVLTAFYGAAMGAYRCLHPQYVFSDFELTGPTGERETGRVAGIDLDARRVYTDVELVGGQGGSVRFNLSQPTEPCDVTATGSEKGFGFIELAEDEPLAESGAFTLPLLVAVKAPALFVLSLAACCLVLYILNLAFGLGLRFLPTMTLICFALAATGVMLGVFVPIVLLFTVVTENYHFMKVLHVCVFMVAGAFGVSVLHGGLKRLAPKGVGGFLRVKALLLSWLMLYALVGGQVAWTLKPFLGTPYLPATPPFRIESGNIYVSMAQSVARMGRPAPRYRSFAPDQE